MTKQEQHPMKSKMLGVTHDRKLSSLSLWVAITIIEINKQEQPVNDMIILRCTLFGIHLINCHKLAIHAVSICPKSRVQIHVLSKRRNHKEPLTFPQCIFLRFSCFEICGTEYKRKLISVISLDLQPVWYSPQGIWDI